MVIGAFQRALDSLVRGLVCLALVMALSLGLSACGETASGLTGSYVDDTLTVAKVLLQTIAPDQEVTNPSQQQADTRSLINDYVALYRPNASVNGLASFTTMQTAVNSLAGHYASYNNRPLPDGLRARIEKELHQAETNVVRGS